MGSRSKASHVVFHSLITSIVFLPRSFVNSDCFPAAVFFFTMPLFIVQPREVMTMAAVRAERWTVVTLAQHLTMNWDVLVWAARRGLVRHFTQCPQQQCQVHGKSKDGYRWRCPRCRHQTTVRKGSWFGHSHLDMRSIICLLYWWNMDTPQDHVIDELGISKPSKYFYFALYFFH